MIVGDIGMDLGPTPDGAGQQYHIYNSASVITAEGQFAGRYDKIHLVPFGEYVPFRKLFFFVASGYRPALRHGHRREPAELHASLRMMDRHTATASSSAMSRCLRTRSGSLPRNGAEVLVNISDDGWYGDTSAPWQHLNMARMRAIENRRWILRDTNNGVTAAIDPYGTVRQSIPRHQVDALPAHYGYQLGADVLHGPRRLAAGAFVPY